MEPASRTHGGGEVLSAIQQKQIMRACANRCECCKQEYPRYILEVRVIGGRASANPRAPGIIERDVVVTCAQCWHATRKLEESERIFRSITAERPPEVRAKIQRILDQKSKSYMPETEFDLEELFADAFDLNGMDLFLNGM
jgi:hypothetical protein